MTEPSQYFKGRTVQEQMDEVIGYVDVRSAEVATTAIASDVAQVHQDMLDADAGAAAAAASAAAAAGTLANAVKKTGEASQSIDGDIDLNDDLNVDGDAAVNGALTVSGTALLVDVAVSNKIEVPTPSANADATTKKYVDDADALDAKLAGATFTGQLKASGQRAYSPGNTTDVVTIGTLDAYTPMVRTTGNQTIIGDKTFDRPISGLMGMVGFWTSSDADTTKWREVFSVTNRPQSNTMFRIICSANNNSYTLVEGLIFNGTILMITKMCSTETLDENIFKIAETSDSRVHIFMRNYARYTYGKVQILANRYSYIDNLEYSSYTFGNGTLINEPVDGETYSNTSYAQRANVII